MAEALARRRSLTMPPITGFKGEYAFLSNFYAHQITIDAIAYPTAEHAFQAAKTHDRDVKQAIAAKDTPAKAKRAGGKRVGVWLPASSFVRIGRRSSWR
jgi:predicted NAD-dependent protein-ADP-ribosyltransferase YbiA (DUF1768 family)